MAGVVAKHSWEHDVPSEFQPNEERKLSKEHMGSTIFGSAIPETIAGLAMPQDKEISRDGSSRVRVDGRP